MAAPPPEQGTERALTDQTEEIIDGGHVGQLEELPFHAERHRAETARRIAFLLVWAFVGSWALHYAVSAYFLWNGRGDLAKSLSEDFRTWLPVISTSAGGAVAYYFAKEK
jgi:hypothetical protein